MALKFAPQAGGVLAPREAHLHSDEEEVPVRLSDVNLQGRSVVAADGQVIGEVAALFLDSSAWQVESVQVKLRKEIADRLGADRGLFHPGTLELPVRIIQSVGDTIVLSLPVDALRTVLPSEGEAAAVH